MLKEGDSGMQNKMGVPEATKSHGGSGIKVKGLRVLKRFRSMLLNFSSIFNITYLRTTARHLLRNLLDSLTMDKEISFD